MGRSQAEAVPAINWREDIARTGYVPDVEPPRRVTLAWSMEGFNKGEHTAAKGSAVLANGTLLAAGDTGVLYRITLEGEVLWGAATWPSSFGIHGTPSIWNGTAYIGAYDGAMYAFDLATGEHLWRTPVGDSIGASPLIHDGTLYISVETHDPSGLIVALDPETGQELWRDERITDHPHSSIALDPERGLLVVGSNDGKLYAWHLSNRTPAWTYDTGDPIKGPIALWDGAAFFGSWDRQVHRVDLGTGQADWTYPTEGYVMSGAGIDPRTGTVYIGSHDGNVYALHADTGELAWAFPTGGRVTSSPTIAGDLVLVGSYDEHLYALDRFTGEEVWSYEASGQVTSSPLVLEDHVAFLERADERTGRLYLLERAG